MSDPVRTCVGCRERFPAGELCRFAWHEGAVRFGRTLPGRGGWVCPDSTCWATARRRGAVSRALRRSVDDRQLPDLPPPSDPARRSSS
ncbi:MAG: YlxR family protein [Actinomycetota bacterium]